MNDTPLEAGMMFACKLKTDKDFLGRKSVQEQRAKGGPTKRKITLTTEK